MSIRKNYFIVLLMVLPMIAKSQYQPLDRLNVFIDCSNTWCDMTFIRSEITTVNFSLDRLAADFHVLITTTNAGGGGEQFNVIFYGQNRFAGIKDTLHFTVSPIATDFERRDLMLKFIKIGLAPAIAKTKAVHEVTISMKADSTTGQSNKDVKDKWNYWVYRMSVDGSFSADQVYKSGRLSTDISANRTTDKSKIYYGIYGGKNRSKYEYDGVSEIVDNHNWGLSHSYVRSLGKKWGAGYEGVYSVNTFSNNKGRAFLRAAVEYNIFPYTDVNTKLLTFSYGPFVQHNTYYDSTLFNKKEELLAGHMAMTSLTMNQKWGSIGIGIAYRNFFHDWSLYNAGANADVNVRITGGLSFYIYFYGGIVHDQIFLPKAGATPEEVLTRRRQLASSFNFETYFGITYRFGSILNNFVNPRFNGPGNWIF